MSTPLSVACIRAEVRQVAPKLIELTERALANGVTRGEVGGLITHLASCAGRPAAMSARRIAKKVSDASRP